MTGADWFWFEGAAAVLSAVFFSGGRRYERARLARALTRETLAAAPAAAATRWPGPELDPRDDFDAPRYSWRDLVSSSRSAFVDGVLEGSSAVGDRRPKLTPDEAAELYNSRSRIVYVGRGATR